MNTIIAREFSLARDFRTFRWSSTLGYNLLRAAQGERNGVKAVA